MPDTVTDNAAMSRYELAVEGGTAFANYRREGTTLVIPYVEAPAALRGKGVARKLMEGVVAHRPRRRVDDPSALLLRRRLDAASSRASRFARRKVTARHRSISCAWAATP